MDLIKRDQCVLSGNKDLEHLYTFEKFPIFMGCTDKSFDQDLFENMSWWISKSTGSIQLNPLIPLDVLYDRPHNDAFGKAWEEHHQLLAGFVSNFGGKSVLEIGGANGILAENVKKKSPDTQWTILEPNPRVSEGSGIKVINGFLDSSFKSEDNYDTVVHSHFFEHAYDPSEILKQINRVLPMGGKHIFSFPNMKALLERFYTNCINFEHTLYLNEELAEWLLKTNGFKLLEKVHFRGHSIMFATEKVSEPLPAVEIPQFYEENKKLFNDFTDFNSNIVNNFNAKIKSCDDPIYLFGAHIFSQFLIGFGLDTSKIVSVLDNSPMKIGKRLYGTPFKVESPAVLKGIKNAKVILMAANYSEEIKRGILDNHNSKVEFWESK